MQFKSNIVFPRSHVCMPTRTPIQGQVVRTLVRSHGLSCVMWQPSDLTWGNLACVCLALCAWVRACVVWFCEHECKLVRSLRRNANDFVGWQNVEELQHAWTLRVAMPTTSVLLPWILCSNVCSLVSVSSHCLFGFCLSVYCTLFCNEQFQRNAPWVATFVCFLIVLECCRLLSCVQASSCGNSGVTTVPCSCMWPVLWCMCVVWPDFASGYCVHAEQMAFNTWYGRRVKIKH